MEPEWEKDVEFPEEWDFCLRGGGGGGGGGVDGSGGGDGVNGNSWSSGIGDSGDSIM